MDRHYTQPEVATAVVNRLLKYGDILEGDRVLDPCVGKGAFSDAVRATGLAKKIVTIDEDKGVVADIHSDFLRVPFGDPFQLVVSNPPFSLAQSFVEKSIGHCDPRGAVAFLLLLQFLGSNGRAEFFRSYPPSTIDVLRPRPSFAENGQTDMREYALFRWLPQDFECLKTSGPRIGFIDWDKPRKRKAAIDAATAT